MTGRITFKNGRHPSRDGGWVEPIEISAGDWKLLQEAAGDLTAADKEAIAYLCENYRDIAKDSSVGMPDIRATLTAMMGLSDEVELTQALANCDASSRALMDGALYSMDGAEFWRRNIRPSKIRAAAWLALQRLPLDRGGGRKKAWRRLVAEWALEFCGRKGLGDKAWTGLNGSTPAVQLLMALLWIIDPGKPPEDESVAVKLLNEVKGKATA